MKLVIFTLLLILSVIIKNFESVSANKVHFGKEYVNRTDAEKECVEDDVRLKKLMLFFRINIRVKVYVCKGDELKSFFKGIDEAKENCVTKADDHYYCKFEKDPHYNSPYAY
ncbi:uncharacterized protein LOC122500548 [Leptopilina heterotoma]|uniref:uncharacterized protein LOC122500548 n=1 Tax=Leptopilina heterotoma TaxID=63436 RepID=UPI001CA9014E|nr:uncharacterized protein LOC122500548 [Leptopilina heterotoma]